MRMLTIRFRYAFHYFFNAFYRVIIPRMIMLARNFEIFRNNTGVTDRMSQQYISFV